MPFLISSRTAFCFEVFDFRGWDGDHLHGAGHGLPRTMGLWYNAHIFQTLYGWIGFNQKMGTINEETVDSGGLFQRAGVYGGEGRPSELALLHCARP